MIDPLKIAYKTLIEPPEKERLYYIRGIIREWAKDNRVPYVPVVFRGSIKYKRYKVDYIGCYAFSYRTKKGEIFLNREFWELMRKPGSDPTARAYWVGECLYILAHEFTHYLQFLRARLDPHKAFPLREYGKGHCERSFEDEAKKIAHEMSKGMVRRLFEGEISFAPRDGKFPIEVKA